MANSLGEIADMDEGRQGSAHPPPPPASSPTATLNSLQNQ